MKLHKFLELVSSEQKIELFDELHDCKRAFKGSCKELIEQGLFQNWEVTGHGLCVGEMIIWIQ